MTRAPLPICVIGAGLVGLRHAQIAATHPDVTLTAVVDTQAETRARLDQLGLPNCASLKDVPETTRAALIATPTPVHLPATLDCLSRGWAVLVEKPVAGTLADADAICRAAQAAGLVALTGHHRRCHPFVQATQDRLTQIGPLVGVQGLWSLRKNDSYFQTAWRQAPGSGPLLTNLSHEIDLLRLFCGEITQVSCLVSNSARGGTLEDTAALSLRFASGALGSFLLSDAGASPWAFEAASGENPNIGQTGADYLRLIGTKAALSFPSLTLWHNPTQDETEWSRALIPQTPQALPTVTPLHEQLTRFARAVAGAADHGLATVEDGRATLAATLAAALSAQTGQPVAPQTVPADYPGWSTVRKEYA